ncbi:MAG: hypothetical protein KAR42_13595 [candidate division Zixibacteria bacterium]|nr:hypothetical protein [candidate division Zixibacteria bacterium]
MNSQILSKAVSKIVLVCMLCTLLFGFTGCNALKDALKKAGIKTGKWVTETNAQGEEERVGCIKGGLECFYGNASIMRDGIPLPKWLGEIIGKADCQNQSIK